MHTYLDAREHLTGAKTSVVHLTQTYRATPDLAGVLNRLLDQQRPQPFFTGAIRYDHPVFAAGTPPRLTISGQPTSAMHLFAIKPRKDTVAPSVAVRTLNARIAEEIAVLLTNGTLEHEDKRRPVSASDIFILTRTTKEGVAAAEALRRRGLPYAFYKQDGLFQTQEAEDVRTLLAAVAEPHDRGRRLRAWMGPFFAVPVAEAQRCLSLPGSHPLLATLFRFRGLADERKWARLFPQILADTGIIQRELFLADSERELTNYLHIFEILLDEAIRTRATLTDILQTLTGFIGKKRTPEGEDGNVQRLESERAAVQIMTMHKAKGLEAAIVFITGGISRNPGFAHIYHEDGQRRLYLGDQPPPGVIRERDEEDQRLAYVALTRAKTRLYLPYYGGRTQPVLGRTMGTYETIDRALDAMVEDEGVSVEPLLERTFKRTEEAPQPHVDDVGPVDVNLQVPQPPPETAALRSTARGAVITSYSRLKQAQGGYQPVSTTDEPVDTSRMADPETPVDELPGGTASGRFIHEMLELVDLGVVQRQAGWSFWGQRSEVQTLFKRGLRRYDRRPEHLQHSVKMVYDALTLPVHFGDLHLADGIAGADRVIREMEFLYSVPELPTPSNGSYVKGFIDVVLEHDGKVIVLDWKTDLLPDYAPKALTAHVEANYALQADLYSLAVLRLLGIEGPDAYERFGGTAYIFVRGLDADGAGIFYTRPPWSMLSQALDRLRATDLVGGRP
ncbi:MAG: 3'-5' exonuclease [Myxococcota bacterium]